MKEAASKQTHSIKDLNKSSVWDVQENDIFRMLNSGSKDADVKDNLRHYVDIIRSAFMIEELKEDTPQIRKSYEKQGYKVGTVALDESTKVLWAIRKRPILRVTDLTYENIRHITASKLVEVLSVTSAVAGTPCHNPSRISSRAVSTFPPRRFPKTVFTRKVECTRRKLPMDMRCLK